MTPIERATRALWNLHPLTEDGVPIPWERVDAGIKADLALEVRAVITSIREPSEAMVKAGNASKPFNVVGYCEGTAHPVVQRSWPAMIDAMLEEG